MKKDHKIVWLFMTITILIGIVFGNVVTVRAADASVKFGSEYYDEESGTTFPVGVYITAEDTIGNYYIELQYDDQRLNYVSGADRVEDGILIMEGTLNASEHRYWIEFEAISGGSAEIKIVTAEIELLNSDTGELFTITEMGQAPVHLSGVDTVAIATEAPTEQMTESTTRDSQNDSQTEDESDEIQTETEQTNPKSKKSRYTIVVIIILVIILLLVISYIMYAYLREQRRKRSLAARRAALEKAERARKANSQRVSQKEIENKTKISEQKVRPQAERNSLKAQIAATKVDSNLDFPMSGKSLKVAVDEVREASSKQNVFDFDQVWGQVIKEAETLGLSLSKNNTIDLNPEEAMETKFGKPVIRVEYVTMRFKVSTSNASGLKEYIIQRLKRQVRFRTFKALDNVSFNVYKGEVVGIIGTNGSGKSTILKIISGALKPTKGRVRIDHKKVQLLTLGTGFDSELTARENVYLNGSIIGYTKEFLDAHYNDIVEFAELQDFMDEKVKNFSSGMVSRLGFAIATIGDAAEILILDEVLAVGDEFFKKKSLARIKEMIHGGSTVLIVSHNMPTIIQNCSKVVWIEKGKLMMVGDPRIVCKAYQNQHVKS